VVQYRWHPLYGRSARLIQSERRASGEFVHVELTAGIVTILPAWKFDPIYCATLKIGVPRVSLAALDDLHRLLIAFESRLLSANGNTVTQEAHDGITGTARPDNEDCPDSEVCSPDSTAPARPRSRRRPPIASRSRNMKKFVSTLRICVSRGCAARSYSGAANALTAALRRSACLLACFSLLAEIAKSANLGRICSGKPI
jgi:hypothetical protein